MSTNEASSLPAAENWGVVLQSVPTKHKKEVIKRLVEIFELEKSDAEDILGNTPLILIDNLSFGLAVRVKKFFQKLGAVAETTNHDMIKKNCFQIVWPQTPDLAFFLKDETKPPEAPAPEKKKEPVYSAPLPVLREEMPGPDIPEIQVAPTPPEETAREPQEAAPEPASAPEEKAAPTPAFNFHSDWERRARELNEKLRKIQDEKKHFHDQHAEVEERVKGEYQQQIEEEKRKNQEIAKAYEDLQKEAQKHETLSREGEEWRSKALALGEKVRELETNLVQKTSALEHVIHEKDQLTGHFERAEKLSARSTQLEEDLAKITAEKSSLQNRIADLEKTIVDTHRELESLRHREHELLGKTGMLERNIQELSGSLKARDEALGQFEKQMLALAEQVREYESLRREHTQLVQDATSIRQQYESKLVEQEVRFAKNDEENRRYRSRMDRKNAAVTRELGEWIRTVDTIRQGLQKLIVFMGSDSAVIENDKKQSHRPSLARGPETSNGDKG